MLTPENPVSTIKKMVYINLSIYVLLVHAIITGSYSAILVFIHLFIHPLYCLTANAPEASSWYFRHNDAHTHARSHINNCVYVKWAGMGQLRTISVYPNCNWCIIMIMILLLIIIMIIMIIITITITTTIIIMITTITIMMMMIAFIHIAPKYKCL